MSTRVGERRSSERLPQKTKVRSHVFDYIAEIYLSENLNVKRTEIHFKCLLDNKIK